MATINSWGSQIPVEVAKGGTGVETLLIHGLVAGNTVGAVTSLTAGTNGQICLGSTGADPVFATITSSDSTIAFTAGAGSLSFQARAGTEDVTGIVEFGTAAETTTGTSTALAVHPAGLNTKLGAQTQYGVVIGGGGAGSNLQALAAGTATQLLQSGGAAANPAYSTFTFPTTTAQGDLLFSSAANTVIALAKSTDATRYLGNTGADNSPAWSQIALSTGVTGTLPVANGGSGQTTYTDGQILIGNTSGNTLAKATLSAGAGIGITNGNGTITIAATASGMGYEEVTDVSKQAVVDVVYTLNNAGLVTITLPDTAAEGSTIGFIGKGAGLFKIAINAGETVYCVSQSTTEGIGGSLTSTEQYASIYLVCTEENVGWVATSISGNFTIV